MKIDKHKLDIALAKRCKSMTDLREDFSPFVLSKMRNNPNYEPSPKTVGRLANVLQVEVEELIHMEGAR